MSRKRSKELVPCLYCSKLFHPRYDLIQKGRGRFCSVQCANRIRRTQVNEATIVQEYKTTKISIKKLAKKHRVGQSRMAAILRKHDVDTTMGRRRNAKSSASRTYRSMAAKRLGRPLKAKEWVHHIDGDRTNNTSDNLQVMTEAEHKLVHAALGKMAFALVQSGLVTFSKTTMQYTITTQLQQLMET